MKIEFKVSLSIGYAGAVRKDVLELEVDDDTPPEQIRKEKEEMAMEWANNFIDISFED